MADIFARSRLRGPAITDAQLYNTDSELSKGVQAGVQGMGASLRTLAGGVGDALGADQFAADQYAAAEALNRDAALRGPRIASFEQLGQQGYNLRNMGDYAAGVIGQSIPSVLPAVAAGALTPAAWGVRGALAAGTAAYAPLETGEVIGRMREDSGGAPFTGQDLAQAAGTGLLSSAVQTIPGAVVGGKIAGKAVGNLAGRTPVAPTLRQAIGHNLWEAPAEGLSEVAGTAIKQLGSGQGLDGKELLEAGIAGTIGGGALSGVGAAADYARGNVTNVTDSAKSAIQTARERLQSGREAAGQGLESLKTTAGEVSGDAWANLAEVGRKAWEGVSESDLGKSIGEKAQTARQRMADILADPEVPEAVKANVQGMMDKVGDRTSQLYTAAVDKARRFEATRKEQGARTAFAQEARSVVDDIINGVDLTDAKAMASATTEQATRMMADAGQKAAEFTRRMGEDLMRRAGVDEETKAQVADAMANLGDKAKQAAVAAKWKAFDGLDKIKEASKGLLDEFNKGRKSVKNRDVDGETRWVDDLPGLPKRSEDYSGLQSVIAGALRPYAKRINERLDKDPAALNQVADGLRAYIEAVTDTEGRFDPIDRSWARAQVAEILGDDASGLLADIAERVGLGENRQMAEKFFTELGELEQLQRSQRGLRDVVARAAPDMKEAQVKELIDESLAWARGDKFKGKTPTQAEVQFDNKRMEGKLQTLLGSKSKVYLRELEKMASPRNELKEAAPGKRDMFDEGSEFDSGVDEYDGNTSVREEDPDVMLKGSGKNQRTLVGDPALARAKAPQYESDTEKRIKDYQTKYPDAQVKFVSLKDSPEMLERIPAEKAKVTAESKRLEAEMPGAENAQARTDALQAFRESRLRALQDEGKGLIEIRRTRNDEKLNDDEVDSLRMDTEKHGAQDVPGRLEMRDRDGKTTDVFDAIRMTSKMMGRINAQGTWTKSDNKSDLTMVARAFADAYAALADSTGNRLRPPAGMGLGDVIVAVRGGRQITAREAFQADKRTQRELETDERLQSLREQWQAAKGDDKTRKQIERQVGKMKSRAEDRKDRELSTDEIEENVADRNAQADGQQDADPTGNISVAGARLREADLIARRNVDGSTKELPKANDGKAAKSLIVHASRIAEAGGVAEKIAARLVTLAQNIGMMGKADRQQLMTVLGTKKPSEAADIINPLARKYADQIMAPKTEAPKPAAKAETTTRTVDTSKGVYGEKTMSVEQLQNEVARLEAQQASLRDTINKSDSMLSDIRKIDSNAKPADKMWASEDPRLKAMKAELALRGGPPNPKAVAAKKAAFLEKAASGDKDLIDELKASTDVKGLQRAAETLRTVIESRIGINADYMTFDKDAHPEAWKLFVDGMTRVGTEVQFGASLEKILADPLVMGNYDKLLARYVGGETEIKQLISAYLHTLEQAGTYTATETFLLMENTHTLGEWMAAIQASGAPDGIKAIAKAVGKVAGSVNVIPTQAHSIGGAFGAFDPGAGTILMNDSLVDPTSTALHEGVHAATVRAVYEDAELHQALYRLMAHVTAQDPGIARAYGMTNTLEFLAEGLSNQSFQNRLRDMPPSAAVEKYLGRTLANAWESFVALVRKAMGIEGKDSALSQLLDLSGRAMKHVAKAGDTRANGREKAIMRPMVPMKALQGAIDKIRQTVMSQPRGVARTDNIIALETIEAEAKIGGGLPHYRALGLTIMSRPAALEQLAAGTATVKSLMMGYNNAMGAMVYPNKVGGVLDTINERLRDLLQNPDAQYAATTRKYSRERTRDPVYTAGEGDYKSMVSFVGSIGPLKNGVVGTVTDDGGYAMFLTEQGATEADGYALRFDVWQREDGKWEVGVDGPEEGMTSFEKYADLFDVVEGSEKDTTYSKFHEGVFSAGEMRRLFRILRDHLAAFGVKPEVITRTRETGEHTDRPRADFSFERISKLSRERVDPIDGTSGRADPINGKEILDYIENVLGDSVRVEFAGILHSGDFTRTDVEDLIRISVHSLDPMSVAYHESLHAFFQKLKDKGLSDVANVVMRAANSPAVVKQLRERLAHSPEALAQLNVAEERAAYAFQFSMSDPTFKLNPEPQGVFEKIAAAFRRLLGIWSDADRALHIMDYFATGQFAKHMSRRNYAAVHLATMGQGRNATLDAARDMTKPLGRLADAIVGAGSARLRDTGIPALRELADVIKRDADVQSRDAGYIPAARLARTHYLNKLVIDLKDVPREKLNDAFEGLQAERDADSPEGRLAQRKVRAYLRGLFDYMGKAGVDMGDLGENYFPRVWDSHYISKHQDSFLEMLRGYGLGEDVMRKIVANEGSEQTVETERPANQHARERVLSMISAEHAAPFLRKDFWQTLEIYTTQATRRAEWARRFGKDNSRLNRMLEEAMEQGATEEQLDTARTYLKGVNGTLGDDLNPSARRLMGNLIVYQNIRLLPMAVFSSLIDPMGVMVRGGTVGDAWETLKRGIKELPKSWQKDPKFDAQHELAETLGVIDDATMSSFMSTQFTQGMVDGTARKINDAFFKYNFMEGFNRSMRVGATQAAVRFIERHVTSPNEHSQRYITELGLTPGSIVMRDGKLALTEADGLTPKQAADVRRAINLWVDGAVLRPDAADRPIWMNDPHWALLSHLKSFVFAFHHTILKRVKHEIDHGNYTPAMVLAGYVPMMLAADLAKDMIANGGDEPEWKQGWAAADHVGYAIQRAGILGVGQFAVDAYGDVKNGGMGIGALAGPTIDQLTDAVQLVGGRQEFGTFALRSMPANSLYRGYVDGDGAEE